MIAVRSIRKDEPAADHEAIFLYLPGGMALPKDHAFACAKLHIISFILKWWPETGSVSRVANGFCNLQILKDAGSAKNARMPKRSCKSLAKFYPQPCNSGSNCNAAAALNEEVGLRPTSS